ncbi:A-kinase-interacting protein 1 isoform X2 [Phyllopteryx taeniolatus]|uniref:A-kinase-interacting protein 1 isoform X2 n=1 Tax=Phyllopteryx taeniolatus TaxID=161469 RepID=UPI002AD2527A|nr:A-kinase-interacting protein 1 isoform X2 [Phyllopteryx taeniolatus]
MATLTELQNSLRQTARLGLEVLERASRRKVDWSEPPHTYTPVADEDGAVYNKKTMAELQEAFSTIVEFMAETNIHCKRFYDSVGCSRGPDIEKKHAPRFHRHIGAARNTCSPRLGHYAQSQGAPEDFYVEVAPGSYTISASRPGSQQQTKMVDLDAGDTKHEASGIESCDLT